MYNKQIHFEEGKKHKKENRLIFFCAVIAIITIGIVIYTISLAFKSFTNKNNSNNDLDYRAKTIGVGENVIDATKQNEEKTEPELTPTENVVKEQESRTISKFPKHDFNVALDSQLPQYSDEIAKKVVDVYFEKTKKIYLTFDDGPSDRTPEILDILDKYGVKATFFVLGSNVDSKPELVKREYEEGHFIAIHSYTHTYSKVYSSPQATLDEYNQALEAVRKAIGVPNYNPHLFRFPGGSSGGPYDSVKRQAIELLKQNEITHTNWNCLTGDAAGSTTIEAMWNELNETATGDDNLVILMHDAGDKKVTVEFLPQLIEKYQSEGYEFCTYYDVMTE